MKKFLLFSALNLALLSSYAATTPPQSKDLVVDAQYINNTIELHLTNPSKSSLMISGAIQYVNNDSACATSNVEYLMQAESSLIIFPFTKKDLATCFEDVYLFKHSSTSLHPKVVGLYELQKDKPRSYITDWSSYIVTPVAFQVNYNEGKITNITTITRYFVYKVSE